LNEICNVHSLREDLEYEVQRRDQNGKVLL